MATGAALAGTKEFVLQAQRMAAKLSGVMTRNGFMIVLLVIAPEFVVSWSYP